MLSADSSTDKQCTKCGVARDLSAYSKDRSKKDGHHSICKPCQKECYVRRRADPAVRSACLERSKEYRRKYPDRFRAGVRDATLRAKYGIGHADYERMLSEQGGGCAICGSSDPGVAWGKHLHVDHDHASGRVRGLLCQPCNTTLGKFNDSAALLRKAAAYVEQGGALSKS